MKNQKLIILLAVLVFTLIGCGKKEEVLQGPVEIDVLVNKEKDDLEENSAEEEAEIAVEIPVKFDCLDEIKSASPDSGLIQIDDMLLQYGSTGAELFEAISQSECEYTSDCNENQLVPAGDTEMIRFKKNGETYFTVSLKNYGEETTELKDCISYDISTLRPSKGNVYYAGASGEMETYSSVKEIMSDYEPQREFTGNDSRYNKKLAVLYKISDINGITHHYGSELYIYYIFDSDTNELSSFMICDYKGSDFSLPW